MALDDLRDERVEIDATSTALLGPSSTTTQRELGPGRSHGRPLYLGSRLLAGCGLVLLSACAPASGWSRTDARTCQPEDPPRVCSRAEPDHGHTLAVADATLIPGECALAPAERAQRIRVETRDPRGQGQRRWVRAPRGKVTVVAIEADGRVDVVERQRCDRRPISID